MTDKTELDIFLRMLRKIKGVTLRDRVKSVDIRKELSVSSIQEKVREMRLRWYGHMQRMEENEVRAVDDMRVPGKRPRGRRRRRSITILPLNVGVPTEDRVGLLA